MSSEAIIAARREAVQHSFNAAEAANRVRFLEGDPKATEEYIFPNQRLDAMNILELLHTHDRLIVSVTKPTKIGADGLILYLMYLATTHPNSEKVCNSNNVRCITGMSNRRWQNELRDKAPDCFKDKIYHHGGLGQAEVGMLDNDKNCLIIIDEGDTANKKDSKLYNFLENRGILDIDRLKANNNKVVIISATLIREEYDYYQWGDHHESYKMTIPPAYYGHKDFLESGVIKEWYPLNTLDACKQWVQEDILDNYGTDYRVSWARVNAKEMEYLKKACKIFGIKFVLETSDDPLTLENEKRLFVDPLINHYVLIVKGKLRRADLVPNKYKIRVGATHERYTKKVDNNTQAQGFPGRMSGYWRDVIESGHKIGPYRTSVKAIEEYVAAMNDPFGVRSYQSAGFKKKENGKVTRTGSTITTPSLIANLEPVPLPDTTISIFGITELYDDSNSVKSYLRTVHPIGRISTYKITDDRTITYRGVSISVYKYYTAMTFKKLDIYGGLNREVTTDNTVARIMPVQYKDEIKWVGIYLKKSDA